MKQMKNLNRYSRLALGPTMSACLLLSAGLSLSACGGEEPSESSHDGGTKAQAPGEGIDYTFSSLDVSELGNQSADWCSPPEFTPGGYASIDKAAFADLLASYTTGWMEPLHSSMLGLDEDALFKAMFETVLSTVSDDCRDDEPLEFAPPSDGELIDAQNQTDVRTEVAKFINEAVELSSGEVLRLSMHDCESCGEPIGSEPFFLNVRLTNDGVLVIDVELQEGEKWLRTLYVTPDAVVMQADLAPLSDWFESFNEDTQSGDVIVPDVTGTVTAVARKDNAGGVSGTWGISNLSFEAQPGQVDNVRLKSNDPCIGMHVGLAAPQEAAQWALHAGALELVVPGSLNCDHPDCGEKERTEDWVYTLGGVSAGVEQPGQGSEDEMRMSVHAQTASTARVGSDVFADGGIGPAGNGGEIGLSVDNLPDGFLVTFEPALNFGGAMTISSFSEQMRMALPHWLQDEIFDITFGGDAKASVFVPLRSAECESITIRPSLPGQEPEPVVAPYVPPQLQIRSGTLEAVVGSGIRTTSTGQCVSETTKSEAELNLTSDWVDTALTCK